MLGPETKTTQQHGFLTARPKIAENSLERSEIGRQLLKQQVERFEVERLTNPLQSLISYGSSQNRENIAKNHPIAESPTRGLEKADKLAETTKSIRSNARGWRFGFPKCLQTRFHARLAMLSGSAEFRG